MSWLQRIGGMFRRERVEAELDEEMRSHLEMRAADSLREGTDADEARYEARRRFGNVTLQKERTRETDLMRWLEMLAQDVRFGWRMLRKSPGFTAVAVLSLALGIGANTGLFSVVDAALLKFVPVRDPGELRIFSWVRHGDPAGMKSHSGYTVYDDHGRPVDAAFSFPAYEVFRKTLPEFSDVVAFSQNQFSVTAEGTADLAFGQYVSANYFSALGAPVMIGRAIQPAEESSSDANVVVLTYSYWSRRFGSDPAVVGRVIQVNRVPVAVIGVTSPSFQGLEPGRAVDLFVPMAMVPATAPKYFSLAAPDFWWVQIFGRLKPGVADESAASAIQAALAHEMESYAGLAAQHATVQIVLQPGARGAALFRGSVRTSLSIVVAIAALVLLIACLNLANLLLAKHAARGREIAIRVSIGASRWRLVRQMMTESLLLAGIGAAAGLLIAKPMMHLLLDFIAGTTPQGLDAGLDARALAFTLCVALLTAFLFGTLPAWRATRAIEGSTLKQVSGIGAARGPRLQVGRYLVATQIALSVVLLVGTGLFLRTLKNLTAINLGFQTENLLTFRTDPGRSGYKNADAAGVYRRLETKIAAIPGVEAVGMSQLPLLGGVVTNGPVRLPGDDKGKPTYFLTCSDSFLSTAQIPVLLGRDLSPADFDHAVRSAVVNETFVRKYLGGRNPIGQIFYPPDWQRNVAAEPFTIVGVARDAHYASVRGVTPPTAYFPYTLRPPTDSAMVFLLRTRVTPMSLIAAVRQAVSSVDVNLPLADIRTEQQQIERSIGTERMLATMVTTFGAMALVLAVIGLYGVMAFSVARRTSEIGIRMALGAARAGVQWMVLRQSLLLAALGLAAGIPAALALTRLVRSLLYGVTPNDLVSLGGAGVVMVAVAALAAWIPARRAAAVDPIKALRQE